MEASADNWLMALTVSKRLTWSPAHPWSSWRPSYIVPECVSGMPKRYTGSRYSTRRFFDLYYVALKRDTADKRFRTKFTCNAFDEFLCTDSLNCSTDFEAYIYSFQIKTKRLAECRCYSKKHTQNMNIKYIDRS